MIDNHRVIIDGPRSETVFNGPIALVDEMYTRAREVLAGGARAEGWGAFVVLYFCCSCKRF